MLIRSEQMKIFDQVSQRNFEDKLCAFVRENMPSSTAPLGDEQLRTTVLSHASVARGFGLRTQSSIAQFVCLAFLPGPPFYENKYLSAFLLHQEFGADVKMQCLVGQLAGELKRRNKSSSK